MKISRLTICFILALSLQAMANSNYAVLLQESPAGAGEINPGIGIHNFGVNETVTLSTVARPGWKFVFWLGEVSNNTSSRTIMSVDGPKIIIAVFQRDAFAMPSDNTSTGSSIGSEQLIRRYDPASGSGSGGGDTPYPSPNYPHYYPPPPTPPVTPPDTPPTPPNTPPVPPEVPEPATMVLLAAGVLGLLTRKKDYLKNNA
jgi:hypothetical protein